MRERGEGVEKNICVFFLLPKKMDKTGLTLHALTRQSLNQIFRPGRLWLKCTLSMHFNDILTCATFLPISPSWSNSAMCIKSDILAFFCWISSLFASVSLKRCRVSLVLCLYGAFESSNGTAVMEKFRIKRTLLSFWPLVAPWIPVLFNLCMRTKTHMKAY